MISIEGLHENSLSELWVAAKFTGQDNRLGRRLRLHGTLLNLKLQKIGFEIGETTYPNSTVVLVHGKVGQERGQVGRAPSLWEEPGSLKSVGLAAPYLVY